MVVGHQSILAALTTAPVPQVVLLTGPDGVGKRTLCVYVAAQVKGSAVINPAVVTAQVIEHILSRASSRRPESVFVILDVGRLTSATANALLKLIEAPPKRWQFLFHSSTPVLPTVLSRAQQYRCSPLTAPQVTAVLSAQGVSPSRCDSVASVCHGSPGEALRLLTLLDYKLLSQRILLAAVTGDVSLCGELSRALAPMSDEDRQEVLKHGDTVRGLRVVDCLRRAVTESLNHLSQLWTPEELAGLSSVLSAAPRQQVLDHLCATPAAPGYLVSRWFTSVVTGAVAQMEHTH